ncbi:MAG: hypothetical protein DM484_11440 [Candidatus Methylumidiphilus alinenensis]|uniref:Sel1 repeat family protein n=1 Tax=Candidatus Methylumidiphilus alinenensis TaxID=2202197 RepID=A0A2W4T3N9_9GAMM|nr:MAG: hypothetical protein DM484_11440 [Candidatus Methylumidiphilus alinenensis]
MLHQISLLSVFCMACALSPGAVATVQQSHPPTGTDNSFHLKNALPTCNHSSKKKSIEWFLKLASPSYRNGFQEAEAAANTNCNNLEKAAGHGNVVAMSWLAAGHILGHMGCGSLPIDEKQAYKWANKASDHDSPEGWLTLGSAYRKRKRAKEAMASYERAVSGGSVEAKYWLATLLSLTEGVQQRERIEGLLKDGMAVNDYRSVIMLLEIDYNFGAEKNQAESILVHWAGLCNVEAMRGLGQWYLKSNENDKASEWLSKAASLGDGQAKKIMSSLNLQADNTNNDQIVTRQQVIYSVTLERPRYPVPGTTSANLKLQNEVVAILSSHESRFGLMNNENCKKHIIIYTKVLKKSTTNNKNTTTERWDIDRCGKIKPYIINLISDNNGGTFINIPNIDRYK